MSSKLYTELMTPARVALLEAPVAPELPTAPLELLPVLDPAVGIDGPAGGGDVGEYTPLLLAAAALGGVEGVTAEKVCGVTTRSVDAPRDVSTGTTAARCRTESER